MGTTGGRTTLILSHIRIITVATDTPGITGVELTTAIIATTAIELKQRTLGFSSSAQAVLFTDD
jgi:hypothetical protein